MKRALLFFLFLTIAIAAGTWAGRSIPVKEPPRTVVVRDEPIVMPTPARLWRPSRDARRSVVPPQQDVWQEMDRQREIAAQEAQAQALRDIRFEMQMQALRDTEIPMP